jgi:hypothetical protein
VSETRASCGARVWAFARARTRASGACEWTGRSRRLIEFAFHNTMNQKKKNLERLEYSCCATFPVPNARSTRRRTAPIRTRRGAVGKLYVRRPPLHCSASPRQETTCSPPRQFPMHPSIHPSATKPCRSARAAYVRYHLFARVQDLVRAQAGWRSARERLRAASPLPRCPTTFSGNGRRPLLACCDCSIWPGFHRRGLWAVRCL